MRNSRTLYFFKLANHAHIFLRSLQRYLKKIFNVDRAMGPLRKAFYNTVALRNTLHNLSDYIYAFLYFFFFFFFCGGGGEGEV